MMNCVEFKELLADLDRRGMLSPEVRAAALAHAEMCVDCGQLLTETEWMDAKLRRLAQDGAASQPSAKIEARLLHEFREQRAAAGRERTWRFAAAAGIAAAVLIALGLWIYRQPDRIADSPMVKIAQTTGAVQQKSEATKLPAKTALHSPAATEEAARTANHRNSERLASTTDHATGAESADAFIPLPEAGDAEPLDDDAVVRVVMSRAALASFGLPVEAMEGEGTVRADLIVSADGTPQAIRLVSQDEKSGPAQ